MTPGDIITLARQKWNAVTDTFYSDLELYTMIYNAEMDLALETFCIKKVYTTSTVISQQEYQKPTNAFSVKRIVCNGLKLYKITDREDDAITLNNQTTTATGSPQYYSEWGTAIELRPIPDTVVTLQIYTYDMPATVTSISVLDVPTMYHPGIADYLVAHMATKDKNFQAAAQYQTMWAKRVQDAKRYEQKFKRGDAFSHVLDEASLPVTIIGAL